jgi:tryptophan synthase alpha chain
MADVPVIQRSSERALKHGVTLHHVLEYVTEFRQKDSRTPIVLMGYANPIERMGHAAFVKAATAAGVDGVLIVDYPPEESDAWLAALKGSAIDPIFLLSPTSSEARIDLVSRVAQGYIYYVSLKGVTGAANIDTSGVKAMIQKIRSKTQVPVGVGFGIRDGATARQVANIAEAVIIGSRIVQELHEAGDAAPAKAREVMSEFRQAVDAVEVRA